MNLSIMTYVSIRQFHLAGTGVSLSWYWESINTDFHKEQYWMPPRILSQGDNNLPPIVKTRRAAYPVIKL